MSGKHFSIGCKTDKFVLLASDKAVFDNGMIISKDGDKTIKLGDKLYMSCLGKACDVEKFREEIQSNFRLHKIRYDYELGPSAAHHLLQKSIADGFKSENQLKVDVILGGFDDKEGKTWLSCIDSSGGAIENKNFVSFGPIHLSVMDTLYQSDMTLEEAINAVKQCIVESQKRLGINLEGFNLVIIDKDGERQEDINL